jgi:hypothetical protein
VDPTAIVVAALALVGGLFGGIGLERYRNARRDHENRQNTYHQLLHAGDGLRDSYEAADVMTMPGDARQYAHFRAGVEAFGAWKAAEAANEWEDAIAASDWPEADEARKRLVKAIRRDVAPGFRWLRKLWPF